MSVCVVEEKFTRGRMRSVGAGWGKEWEKPRLWSLMTPNSIPKPAPDQPCSLRELAKPL